jgi:NYN domain/OST-HTH/LOTUS domain
MAGDSSRLAVLIDADNTSARRAADVMAEVARLGTATVKRAYGDWTTQHLSGWKPQLLGHAIQPIQQFAYTVGKNSTDSALIIDAMDLLYAGNLDGFVIVSSDSDFTRLATRLRESGMSVYGIGRRNTPQPFQDAVEKFTYLEVLRDSEPEATPSSEEPAESTEPTAPLPDPSTLLTDAIKSTSSDDGWADLSRVGSYLNRNNSSFDPRNYGYSKLVELARAQNFVDVEQDDHGHARIRLRSARPPKKAAKKQPARRG